MDVEVNVPFVVETQVVRLGGKECGEGVSAVRVTAAMPKHGHGTVTQPETRVSTGPQQFTTDGLLLHMPGEWKLYVDVMAGNVTRRITMEIRVG
jgi:hypothetical protein